MGKAKDREKFATTWESTMNYAFVFARKVGLPRYVVKNGVDWIITDAEPECVPYYEVDPMGEWKQITKTGQLTLPTLRR